MEGEKADFEMAEIERGRGVEEEWVETKVNKE